MSFSVDTKNKYAMVAEFGSFGQNRFISGYGIRDIVHLFSLSPGVSVVNRSLWN